MHGQVTHASSLHSFECLSLVSSYVGGFVFFSHPTRSLISSFSLPLSQVHHDTTVSDTSVSPGQVSFHTNIRRCDIKIYQATYLYTSILQVSRLCIAKPTAWKRGCGKVKSPPIPHCQKESAAMLAFFLRTLFENSTLKYTWQLT